MRPLQFLLSKIVSLFLLCSGVVVEYLDICPKSERSKYIGIGGAVFFTAIFAFITSTYALYRVFVNTGGFLFFIAIILGFIWASFIFTLDRYIVASMRKKDKPFYEFKIALPRLICQLIFIEEPEVHLHAQVQQTFITNIWNIISNAAKETGDETLVPQFLVTTHSSHILDAVDFAKVRHFQRCVLDGEDRKTVTTLNASKVQSLREFKPEPIQSDGKEISPEEALKFLKRYLKLTHCDLFFADAAILVEGTVEKLLLPKMVEKSTPNLCTNYLSILEVGGAYAHRFSGLLKFLNIPYLIITDLDSVEAAGNHLVCRGDTPNALTSNASLKTFFGVTTVKELLNLKSNQKVNIDQDRCVTFQTDVQVVDGDNQYLMIPRTIEEAFAFGNFGLLRSGQLDLGATISDKLDDAYQDIYQRIKSSNFKKTEFALNVLTATEGWDTPTYIAEGLKWLETRLASGLIQPKD